MILDALKVTAMMSAAVVAVGFPLTEIIIVRISVGKSVGHDEIEHIFGREALRACLVVAGTQLKLLLRRFATLFQIEGESARAGGVVDVEIHKQIVRILHLGDLLHRHAGIILQRELGSGYILAIEHHLQLVVFHPRVPERRIHALDCHTPCALPQAYNGNNSKKLKQLHER